MRTQCGTILAAVAVATCAVGAEHCRPTGELQEKAQALADLAVKEGLQGALQFCAYKDGKCIVDVWAGTMTTNVGAAKIDGERVFDLDEFLRLRACEHLEPQTACWNFGDLFAHTNCHNKNSPTVTTKTRQLPQRKPVNYPNGSGLITRTKIGQLPEWLHIAAKK